MKITNYMVFMLLICALMCGCNFQNNDAYTEYDSFTPQAKKDSKSTFSAENYNFAEIKFEDEGYYYLREKADFSIQYAGTNIVSGVIDAKDTSGELIYLSIIDENGNFYHRRDSSDTESGEIGMYSPVQKTYKKLMDIPPKSQAGIITVNVDYLVWQESMDNSNWGKTRLHLFKQKENVDTVIYEYTTNPDTGFVYGYNWSEIIIIGNKIYFDDIIGKENDIMQISIFCYDIETGIITEIQKQGKTPMKYMDKVAWNEKGENPNDINVVTYDGNKKEVVVKFKATDTMGMANTGGRSMAYIDWLNTKRVPILYSPSDDEEIDDTYNDCMGLQIWNDGNVLPIIISKSLSYLSQPQTNGRIFIFGGSDFGTQPVFYDLKYDKLVVADKLPMGHVYGGFLNNNILVFYFTEQDTEGNDQLHQYYSIILDD